MSENLTHDEETMQKVWGALLKAGLSEKKVIDVVSDMQNAGILFRERGETEWEYGNATELGFMYGMPSLEAAIRNCNSVTTVTLPDGTIERYKRRVTVHRLVAEAFIPNPDGNPHVLHRNDDRTDNSVDNLYWGTPQQNRIDSVTNGVHGYAKRRACSRGHEYTVENTYQSKAGRVCRRCKTIYRQRAKEKR